MGLNSEQARRAAAARWGKRPLRRCPYCEREHRCVEPSWGPPRKGISDAEARRMIESAEEAGKENTSPKGCDKASHVLSTATDDREVRRAEEHSVADGLPPPSDELMDTPRPEIKIPASAIQERPYIPPRKR